MKNRKITEGILDILNNRGGFDGWWGSIDEDIQEEIKLEIDESINMNIQ